MGNKLKFLKEYNGYIENIENLNDKEDISMFNEFEKHTKNNNLILLDSKYDLICGSSGMLLSLDSLSLYVKDLNNVTINVWIFSSSNLFGIIVIYLHFLTLDFHPI